MCGYMQSAWCMLTCQHAVAAANRAPNYPSPLIVLKQNPTPVVLQMGRPILAS